MNIEVISCREKRVADAIRLDQEQHSSMKERYNFASQENTLPTNLNITPYDSMALNQVFSSEHENQKSIEGLQEFQPSSNQNELPYCTDYSFFEGQDHLRLESTWAHGFLSTNHFPIVDGEARTDSPIGLNQFPNFQPLAIHPSTQSVDICSHVEMTSQVPYSPFFHDNNSTNYLNYNYQDICYTDKENFTF
ncbi:4016_t:CDS:1 [Acaulospora morrowiae]|uniref:4016_t:CDS:1 n=1 Tax=Acaulospora morrowiae TaxID=94023 RepID=A0A9N9GEY0_9GLOM|nr:4016_t:CDS:1 [Acaulospora morrowiae]